MLDKIKLLLGIEDDDSDELLTVLINICKEEVYTYCNLPEYDSKLDYLVVQMVIERYNCMGSEGARKQESSGISTSYYKFYSDRIVKLLDKNRRVKTV